MNKKLVISNLIVIGSALIIPSAAFSQTEAVVTFSGTVEDSCTVSNVIGGVMVGDELNVSSNNSPGGTPGSFEVSPGCNSMSFESFGSDEGGNDNILTFPSITVPGVSSFAVTNTIYDISGKTDGAFTVRLGVGSTTPMIGQISGTVVATLTAN